MDNSLIRKIAVWGLVPLFVGGVVVGGWALFLHGFSLSDEWNCSRGEAPAGTPGHYDECFKDGSTLPASYHWDPFGRRPEAYNCDKHGWQHITRPAYADQYGDVPDDCVRSGTRLPAGWVPSDAE